jgi:spore maturation protein CgeB
MARDGFINNRTYDIGALGLFQISNAVPGIDNLGVVTYNNAIDLRHKIEYYINNENSRKEIAAHSRNMCKNETFEARVKKIIDII